MASDYLSQNFEGRTPTHQTDWAEDDIRKILPLPVYQPRLSRSVLSTLATCPRKFLLQERLRLGTSEYAQPLEIGSFFHLAMAVYYQGGDHGAVNREVTRAVELRGEKLREQSKDPTILDSQVEQMEKDAALGQVMAQLYWEKYPLDTENYRVRAVEDYVSEIEVPGVSQVMTNVRDVELLSVKHNGVFLLDHKTTSQSPTVYRDTMPFNFQARMYRLGYSLVDEPQTGLPILGFVFNVVRKPTITMKQDQSFPEFLDECRDWYAGKCDEIGTGDVFKSGPRKGLPKPRWDHTLNSDKWSCDPPMAQYLMRFEEPVMPAELIATLQMGAKASKCEPLLQNFPRLGELTGACTNHYGRSCKFLPLCNSDPMYWEEIVGRHFTVRTT